MARKDNLRISSYLDRVDVGEGFSLIFNGLTSRIDLVASDVACQMQGSKSLRDFSSLLPEEIAHLLDRGHLTRLSVREEREEFRKLAEHVLEADQSSYRRADARRTIGFTLTYKCNLSCSYCYQGALRKNDDTFPMGEGFVDEFFRLYFNKLFPGGRGKNTGFVLIGGEPLLPGNRGAIERILRYAKKHGANVSAVTNATTLSGMLDLTGPEIGKIQSLQVTLDGGRAFHDATRVPRSGAPTFDHIIGSLRELIGVKANVSLRIHLHRDGIETTRELVDYLDREAILGHERVSVYFAPLSSFGTEVMAPRYLETFSEIFQRVALKQNLAPSSMFARGFASIMDTNEIGSRLKTRFCPAGAGLLRLVDSLGDIYDCYEDAGIKARRIGRLAGGQVRYFKLEDTYKRRHILNIPQCLKCSIGLFCGGGCMQQARVQKGSLFKAFCEQNKETVRQTLKACFLLSRAGKKAR